MAQINIRVDDNVKKVAEEACAEIGMSLSAAIKVYKKTEEKNISCLKDLLTRSTAMPAWKEFIRLYQIQIPVRHAQRARPYREDTLFYRQRIGKQRILI